MEKLHNSQLTINFKANMFRFEWTMSCAPNVLRACFDLFVSSALSTRKYHESSYCLVTTRKKTKTLTVTFQQNLTKPNANIWFNEMQAVPSILLLVTNKRRCTEDAGKMFGADAICANVAKQICVFVLIILKSRVSYQILAQIIDLEDLSRRFGPSYLRLS